MTTQTLKAREDLEGTIKGSILVPDDPGYEEARHDRFAARASGQAVSSAVPSTTRWRRGTVVSMEKMRWSTATSGTSDCR